MPLFRKKPITVEAHQWFKNGDHPLDYAKDLIRPHPAGSEVRICDGVAVRYNVYTGFYRKSAGWEGDVVRYFRHPNVSGSLVCSDCGRTMNQHGWIDSVNTLNPSGCTVCPGDWILPELSDPTKYYPCKPGIFYATYEPVTP
jgi:hypothetical protein